MSTNSSAPPPQTNSNGNGAQNRNRSGGRSTPESRGNEGGEGNGYPKRGNPQFKKNWQQPRSGNPQDAAPVNGAPNGDDRRRRNNKPNENGDNQAQNGEKRFEGRERRNDGFRRRRDKEYIPASTPNQNGDSQEHQPTLHHPQVDQARVAESRRINALISTPEPQLSADDWAVVAKVKEVVPNCSDVDIINVLQQTNFDQSKAAAYLLGEGSEVYHSWSEVVKKPRAPKEQLDTRQKSYQAYDQRQQDQAERPRGSRADRRNGQAERHPQPQGQHQPSNAQQPVPQTQHAQQVQHQMQMQQLQQFAQQHPQLQQHPQHGPQGEDLIMELSRTINDQLEKIAEKTRLLIQMKNELESIHASGKDNLTNLQERRKALTDKRERLKQKLEQVESGLIEVERDITKAEEEKFFKLQDLQRMSSSHGFLLTN